jgi:Domain of unknown function (DUF6457)
MRRDEWLAEFAEKLGVDPPTKEEVAALLDIAATAAHSSERTAAPIACWLAGRTDLSLGELKALADSVAPERERQPDDQRA